MTTTDVNDLTIEHLDEDWEPPCEMADHERFKGDAAAEWIVIVAPCCSEAPPTEMWCTTCKDSIVFGVTAWCGNCGQRWTPASTSLVSIEPLNRRTT